MTARQLKKKRRFAQAAGDMFYFTGKECLHGHISKRYATTGGCVTCQEEAHDRIMADDKLKEEKRQYAEDYYSEHKDDETFVYRRRLMQMKRYYAHRAAEAKSKSDWQKRKARELKKATERA